MRSVASPGGAGRRSDGRLIWREGGAQTDAPPRRHAWPRCDAQESAGEVIVPVGNALSDRGVDLSASLRMQLARARQDARHP